MSDTEDHKLQLGTLAARCHEIQVSAGHLEIHEFETVPLVGQAVRLSIHLRGLPIIQYDVLKLTSSYYLNIQPLLLEKILHVLEEVGFVRLITTGNTIKSVLPTVPYYEDMYDTIGEYATTVRSFNEAEQLALYIVEHLSKAPENIDTLRNKSGAETSLFRRSVQIGTQGSYILSHRARGRDILISPTYFSENAHIFADAVAANGAPLISSLMEAVRVAQGWPLKLIEERAHIGGQQVTPEQVKLLKRLAQQGAVKPPSITTTHAGVTNFIFTPTPTGAALSPTKRDTYEKAMAIVAAIRQGQLLPREHAIRSPAAVLYKLNSDLKLGKATTEASQQYRNLVHLRIARLVPAGNDYHVLEIIDTQENREALRIAYSLVVEGAPTDVEVDEEARLALQRDLTYIESIVASADLRRKESIQLTPQSSEELDRLLLGLVK